MRLRIVFSTLLLCLLIVPTVQAQMQSLDERNADWANRLVIGTPPDDDEGDDEASDCLPYPAMVPKTGQMECWTAEYPVEQIACAGTGQDGEHQNGVESPDPRFTDNLNGTVTDNLTGLVWLQDANCFGTRKWKDALSDAANLSDGSCGLSDGSVAGDWRMPSFKELLSLIDYGQNSPALPLGHPFSAIWSGNTWSSTSSDRSPHAAWFVYFNFGNSGYSGKSAPHKLWPVRGPE